MTTSNPHNANWGRAIPAGSTAGYEMVEQLLALADQIGAAYAEACQQLSSTYSEAYQKLVTQAGTLMGKPSEPQQAQMLNAMMDPSSLAECLDSAQENALVVGEQAAEMGIEIGLSYLKAFEQAALAVAKFQEHLGAASQVDVVKTSAATGAELVRKVTRAGADTLRDRAG